MKPALSNPIIHLPKPENWKAWILIALITKGLLLLHTLNKEEYNPIPGFWGSYAGDTESYINPIENLIDSGNYTPDYRMPGYGVIYLPFYYFFSKPTALNLLILTHILFTVLATYFLGLIARRVFQSNRLFYLVFFAFAISTFSNLFDHVILTESLTTSLLVISVYAFLRFSEFTKRPPPSNSQFIKTKNLWLFLSGLILTEVIFLRPGFTPLLILFLIVLIRASSSTKRKLITHIIIFLLPFFIIDGSWIIRNWKVNKRFTPLTTSPYYPETENTPLISAGLFIKSWGGNIAFWVSDAEIRWFGFGVDQEFPSKEDIERELPEYIFTSKFNLDSLQIIKSKIANYEYNSNLSIEEKQAEYQFIDQKLALYTQSIKKEKPFLYYIQGPLSIAKKAFIHSGTSNLFKKPSSELSIGLLSIKLFYSFFYYFVLIFGFIGLILLAKSSLRFEKVSLITGIVVYTVLLHPFILRFAEIRYFYPAWPFLVICAIYALWKIQKSILPQL